MSRAGSGGRRRRPRSAGRPATGRRFRKLDRRSGVAGRQAEGQSHGDNAGHVAEPLELLTLDRVGTPVAGDDGQDSPDGADDQQRVDEPVQRSGDGSEGVDTERVRGREVAELSGRDRQVRDPQDRPNAQHGRNASPAGRRQPPVREHQDQNGPTEDQGEHARHPIEPGGERSGRPCPGRDDERKTGIGAGEDAQGDADAHRAEQPSDRVAGSSTDEERPHRRVGEHDRQAREGFEERRSSWDWDRNGSGHHDQRGHGQDDRPEPEQSCQRTEASRPLRSRLARRLARFSSVVVSAIVTSPHGARRLMVRSGSMRSEDAAT